MTRVGRRPHKRLELAVATARPSAYSFLAQRYSQMANGNALPPLPNLQRRLAWSRCAETCRSALPFDHFLELLHISFESLVNVSVGDPEVRRDELCTGELLLIILAAA